MDLDHNKVKMDWFYLKKIIISTIRGDQFLYIFLEFGYKHSYYCYNIFLSISDPNLLGSYLHFIPFSFFYLYPPHVDQIAGVNPCLISSFLKFLGSNCKTENYYSGITSSLIQPKNQLQSIQCGGNSFLLDIIWLSSILCFQDACPYQQNLLERCPGWQTTPLDLGFVQPRMYSSSDHLLRLL